jgi:hypothetical protein
MPLEEKKQEPKPSVTSCEFQRHLLSKKKPSNFLSKKKK